MHLVDSSTIIAILTGEKGGVWALATLQELRDIGGVYINQVVYSETCALATSEREAESWLAPLVERLPLSWECAFPAGKAYRLYKSRGGTKARMLPDFLIAAHADSLGWALVTHNPQDIKTYFPKLKLISPPKH